MILLLGGTGDAVGLARQLAQAGVPLIYSIAGLVRHPDLPVPVISGGFSQYGGLEAYLSQQGITGVLDATHPYATNISKAAVQAATSRQIPIWRYLRAGWQAGPGDVWRFYPDWTALCSGLARFRRVFLTTGQLTTAQLHDLEQLRLPHQHFILRTAVRPVVALPDWVQPVQAVGPFDLATERAFLQRHRIDVLVTKNSGGEATYAKLLAARQLSLPVLLLQRPVLPAVDSEWQQLDLCIDAVSVWHQNRPLSSA